MQYSPQLITVWTADAPKRKILQSQAPDNPGASESRKYRIVTCIVYAELY